MTDQEKEYYTSHGKLSFIGKAGQDRLQQSKVLVIGAGGLGCPCLLALTGAGAGTIGVADFDYVSISNLHRQHLYAVTDAGKKKAVTAKEKLSAYNPFINIVVHDVYVSQQNILALLQEYDLVVDCTDNYVARYLINDACVYLDKPWVYGAIHTTEGQVTVFNFNGSGTLRCLFPSEENDTTQSCADIGAYNIITGMTGLLMANEVIKMITIQEAVLAGTLLTVDALSVGTMKWKYALVKENREKSRERFEGLINSKV